MSSRRLLRDLRQWTHRAWLLAVLLGLTLACVAVTLVTR
jgi:hypothetical protein